VVNIYNPFLCICSLAFTVALRHLELHISYKTADLKSAEHGPNATLKRLQCDLIGVAYY